MPTISLRLTEEEHAQLTAWAHDGRRSVQKELIWRLFSNHHIPERGGIGPAIQADAQPRDVVTRTVVPPQPETTQHPRGIDADWLARRAGKRK